MRLHGGSAFYFFTLLSQTSMPRLPKIRYNQYFLFPCSRFNWAYP